MVKQSWKKTDYSGEGRLKAEKKVKWELPVSCYMFKFGCSTLSYFQVLLLVQFFVKTDGYIHVPPYRCELLWPLTLHVPFGPYVWIYGKTDATDIFLFWKLSIKYFPNFRTLPLQVWSTNWRGSTTRHNVTTQPTIKSHEVSLHFPTLDPVQIPRNQGPRLRGARIVFSDCRHRLPRCLFKSCSPHPWPRETLFGRASRVPSCQHSCILL